MQTASATDTTYTEAVRVVRELRAADIPVAAVLRTGEAVRTSSSDGIPSSRELSSHQQLEQAGLEAQDFTVVSSVSYSGKALLPAVLEATVSALGSDATASSTLVVSNVPLDLEAFRQAGASRNGTRAS